MLDSFNELDETNASPTTGSMLNRADDVEQEVDPILREEFKRDRTRGFVIDCDGERAIVAAQVEMNSEVMENYWSVGQLITIKVGESRVVGLTHKVEAPSRAWDYDQKNHIHVHLELVGEIVANPNGRDFFTSGIANYPQMGCIAHRIRADDLAVIYENDGDSVIKIGTLTQDNTVDAKIDLDKLLSRHFAVVGTTGVGKSTSVTLLLRKIVEKRPDIRIMIMDPHNEFASAFPDHAVVVDSTNLQLPFWFFKLDEFAEVVFRGQKDLEEEFELLRDLIPLAKQRFLDDGKSNGSSLVRKASKTSLTADMPVPYRIPDLLKLIDERLGLLEGKAEKPLLKSLAHRLESISSDPRFKFMFDAGQGGDIMEQVISNLFRVPQNGKPICVMEMSGLPSEVVNSVVSVLCRMSFDLAMNSEGGIQTLVVCEEAHRYIPADEGAGFWPTRQAIARIAKEGRKYGVFLGIITQRPGELDPTILSQCNTIFSMRLGNQRDQEIIRGAVTNGAKSTISFLSSIANRECIAFGEAVHTPMRLTFETIAAKDLPGARIYEQQAAVKAGRSVSLSAVLRRMRQENRKIAVEEADTPNSGLTQSGSNYIPQQESSEPGNEINSILNAAYNGSNGSLKPQVASRSQSHAQPQPGAVSLSHVVDRRAEPSPQLPNEIERRNRGGAGDLIKNFRS